MWIPEDLYKKILEVMPRPSVDTILRYSGDVLLLRRKIEPLKGYWSLPGGRVEMGETTEETAARKVREELGIWFDPRGLKLVHVDTYLFTERQDITITYALSLTGKPKLRLDYQHEDYGWFQIETLPSPIHPTMLNLLKSLVEEKA